MITWKGGAATHSERRRFGSGHRRGVVDEYE